MVLQSLYTVCCRYASPVLVLQKDVFVGNNFFQPRRLYQPHHRLLLSLQLWTRCFHTEENLKLLFI